MCSLVRSGFTMLLILLCGMSSAATPGGREYQIKAAFLSNFTSYTQWPDMTQPDIGVNFRFCSSNDSFIEIAQSVLADKQVAGKSIELLAVNPGEEQSCNLIFIQASDTELWVNHLKLNGSKGILVVGEHRGFADEVGDINFFLAGNKVRFEINLDSVKKSGLIISSRLLRLAKLIRREGGE